MAQKTHDAGVCCLRGRLRGPARAPPPWSCTTPSRKVESNHEDKAMRKLLFVVAVAALAAFAFPSAASAQSGHFVEGGGNAPECVDIGTQLRCTGKVAGLGGTTFEITVTAPGVASVECTNPGGNVAPGQDTTITAAGTTGPQPTPRNGQFVFSLMTATPTVPNFPTCPNPGWTATVVDVEFGDATITLTEDGVVSDVITVPVS
jgi:hypothetical protein